MVRRRCMFGTVSGLRGCAASLRSFCFSSVSEHGKGEANMQDRIVYIENKQGGVDGPGRIGRVTYSKSGRTLYYRGRAFRSLNGRGFKANYYDVETGEEYWISGPKRDGTDKLYGGIVEIDD